MTVNPDGISYRPAGSGDRGLVLTDESERARFVEHLRRRHCGDRYPSMQAWKAAQHEDFLEEARWRFSGG